MVWTCGVPKALPRCVQDHRVVDGGWKVVAKRAVFKNVVFCVWVEHQKIKCHACVSFVVFFILVVVIIFVFFWKVFFFKQDFTKKKHFW